MSAPVTAESTQVLIAGAGPTGLTLAAELLRHGVACRIVEQLEQPVTYSKAAVVHARTMEVFEWMGVVREILTRAKPVHGANIYAEGARVAHLVFERTDSPYAHPYGISQHDTEAILTAHLERLGGKVERRASLDGFTEDEGGVHATIAHENGALSRIDARWLVGCDGSHSRVRELLKIPFEGSSYEERLIQADVRVDWPKQLDGDEIVAFLHPEGSLACFPLFTDGRYRLISVLPHGVELEPTLPTFQKLVDERAMPGARVRDPAWMVGFRIHCRMVPRYREGSVFLAGDAAHIHSPAGGQGMNTGIQDAFNLAWKLALAAKGRATNAVLDSYSAERQPIARATLDATDLATRFGLPIAALRRPLAVELRNQMLSLITKLDFFRERASRGISMLDLNYRKSPLVAQDRASMWTANLTDDASSEAPSLNDWMAFGDAPEPGDRAGDVLYGDRGERLFDIINRREHTLLLFDGAAATDAGYENLASIAREVRKRWGAEIAVLIVLPLGRQSPKLGREDSIADDRRGLLHLAFGARSECCYLIRPDGYVAYRGQPADAEKLFAYLRRVFLS